MASKIVSVRLQAETLEKLSAMSEVMHRPRAWLMAHAMRR
jgi:predicted transcriptional regulator